MVAPCRTGQCRMQLVADLHVLKCAEIIPLNTSDASAPSEAGESVKKPSDGVTLLSEGDGQPVFPFEFQISRDLNDTVPISNEMAFLQCSVRHLSETDINIVPGVTGEINLGIRLNDLDGRKLVYEARLFLEPRTLTARAWTPVLISIPRSAVEKGKTYTLIVDFLMEHVYWFYLKGGSDYRYFITFSDELAKTDVLGRLDAIEQDLADFRKELTIYNTKLDKILDELSPILSGKSEFRMLNHSKPDLAPTELNLKKTRQKPQKNLIIIANCHAPVICDGFYAVPALRRYFRARYYDIGFQEYAHEETRRDLENCDLLVVQDISDWEDCPLREWIADRAETIMFPCVRFASLWPFDSCNGPTDPHAIEQEGPNLTFPYLDGLLARLRTEIPDQGRRFETYRSLNFGAIVNYVRAHEFETRRLLVLDKKYDCEIGRFILDRFQDRKSTRLNSSHT